MEPSTKYHLILHEWSAPNDLGTMTEMEVYGYVRTRLHGDEDAADAVLRELEEKGEATVQFETSLGKARLEIHRQSGCRYCS